MKRKIASIGIGTLLAAVTCSTALSAQWLNPRVPSATSASTPCTEISSISGDYDLGEGNYTNGIFGTPQAGERFRFTFSGAGSGSFRIVGDPGGVVTLAGPTAAPGTLVYTAGTTFPSNAVGVGFFFDSGQGIVTLSASCLANARPAPALGAPALALLGGLIALAGACLARRRRPARPEA